MSIFKSCDIRGSFGDELTLEHARLLAHAIAFRQDPRVALVAGDARLSTPALKDALIDAFLVCGVHVIDLGTVPTPVFYFTRRKLGIMTGVMVTASHNPPGDNGFKLTIGDMPITHAEIRGLQSLMEARVDAIAPRPGQHQHLEVVPQYREHIEAICPFRSDMRVVIDAGSGMMGPVAPHVFRDLGYDVVELFTEVDGSFPHHLANPAVRTNLEALAEQVRATGAALGIAFDGDGDRAGFVDETGAQLVNDRAIVLFARDALARQPAARIVYDFKCSDVVREEILKAGGVPHMERSGYTFIKTTLLRLRAAYGGELSGHHFFAEVGGDDALIAALRMAELLQRHGRPLSALSCDIPRYPNTPDLRVRVEPGEADAIIGAVRDGLAGVAEVSEIDGVRARFADGWGLVRASVTEPAITLRFEGRTEEALERIKQEFVRAAPQLAGRL